MQGMQVARHKLTDPQSEFSIITAFWQVHSNKTPGFMSQSKARLIKGEGKGRGKAQILLLCRQPFGRKAVLSPDNNKIELTALSQIILTHFDSFPIVKTYGNELHFMLPEDESIGSYFRLFFFFPDVLNPNL